MDPLSDVLLLLKPSTYKAGGFDLGGDFAIEFPRHESIKCYAIVSGQCWLSVESVPEAVHLTAGDCFLLPRGLGSLLASDLTLTPADARAVFPFPLNGRIASCNGGGDCLLVGGNFVLAGKQADMLLPELLPSGSPLGLPDVEVVEGIGAPGVIRTPDLLVRSQTLYPTELRARRTNYSKRSRGFTRCISNNAAFLV